jgi:hypothetical protein
MDKAHCRCSKRGQSSVLPFGREEVVNALVSLETEVESLLTPDGAGFLIPKKAPEEYELFLKLKRTRLPYMAGGFIDQPWIINEIVNVCARAEEAVQKQQELDSANKDTTTSSYGNAWLQP